MVKLDMPDGSTFEYDEDRVNVCVKDIMGKLIELPNAREAALVILNVHMNALILSFGINKEKMLMAAETHKDAISGAIENFDTD